MQIRKILKTQPYMAILLTKREMTSSKDHCESFTTFCPCPRSGCFTPTAAGFVQRTAGQYRCATSGNRTNRTDIKRQPTGRMLNRDPSVFSMMVLKM